MIACIVVPGTVWQWLVARRTREPIRTPLAVLVTPAACVVFTPIAHAGATSARRHVPVAERYPSSTGCSGPPISAVDARERIPSIAVTPAAVLAWVVVPIAVRHRFRACRANPSSGARACKLLAPTASAVPAVFAGIWVPFAVRNLALTPVTLPAAVA